MVTIQGGGGGSKGSARLDASTEALETVSYAHHEIHSGSHFFVSDQATGASGATREFLITTPDTTKWSHLIFEAQSTLLTTMALYEGADRNGTNLQVAYNNNRNSGTSATTTVHEATAGGTTDGTLIWTAKWGTAAGGGKVGGAARQDSEIILLQDTKYILRLTSGANNNVISTLLEWYEHTNKN